jgi:hypothetical protein
VAFVAFVAFVGSVVRFVSNAQSLCGDSGGEEETVQVA